jgi:hypothetical protein
MSVGVTSVDAASAADIACERTVAIVTPSFVDRESRRHGERLSADGALKWPTAGVPSGMGMGIPRICKLLSADLAFVRTLTQVFDDRVNAE